MKLATLNIGDCCYIGIVDAHWTNPSEGRVLLLNHCPGWPERIDTIQKLIEYWPECMSLLASLISGADTALWQPIRNVKLCAPIPVPLRNVLCLGWNYAEHAKESTAAKGLPIQDLPEHPIVFTKATTTVNGPFDEVVYDENVTKRLDWEVELGVVIGRKGRHIDRHDALQYVFGYTVINDISARDLQKRHQQFFMGKSVDGTCPMGPWIVTADEIANPQNLHLRCLVNNIVKQDACTDQQIFSVAQVISTLSSVMTLLPGDIIATGTPSGVGFARTPPEYLTAGDVVECEVEGIGRIINTVVPGK